MSQINISTLAEHSLSTLRRDFTTAVRCAFCPNKLTSGTAFILLHPEHGEVSAGPICGPKWGDKGLKDVPDFTRHGFQETDEKEESDIRKSSGNDGMTKGNRAYLRAIEYLLLRFEKLPELGFWYPNNPELSSFLEKYRSGNFTQIMTDRTNEIAKGCQQSSDVAIRMRSYNSLMLTYTHAYWIDECLKAGQRKLRAKNAERLRDFKKGLIKYKTLTIAQIEQVNRELNFVFGENAPILEPEAFVAMRPSLKKDGPRSDGPLFD